ncbi:hypothetical protein SAMN05216167_10117 [Spirosoma endophyticum]|uniref:Uncharacterized protein n=2 Tax=Spirosoma endophyticum TaxID=662367 RepID=A0A1I1EPV6_9BACT|nr:hypothetical protein SAMN05216167_10117 [Spirosoma endophyticum]
MHWSSLIRQWLTISASTTMVLLLLSIVDTPDQVRHFQTYTELEDAFELVSQLKATNHQIQQAYIIDKGQRIELPLEAFDGGPFAAPIQKLQREWEAILSTPLPSPAMDTHNFLVSLTHQRIVRYRAYIQFIEHAITNLQLLVNLLEANFVDDAQKDRLLNLYR